MEDVITHLMCHLSLNPTLRTCSADTILRAIKELSQKKWWNGKACRLVIRRLKRIDGLLDLWEGEYTYRCILTNDYESSVREIADFYNLSGGKERIFTLTLGRQVYQGGRDRHEIEMYVKLLRKM